MSNKVSNFPNAAKPKATPEEIGQLVGVMDELRRLPPVSKNDPEQVRERLDYYFQYCTENGIKCSVEGMTLALGKSRQSLWAVSYTHLRASRDTSLSRMPSSA